MISSTALLHHRPQQCVISTACSAARGGDISGAAPKAMRSAWPADGTVLVGILTGIGSGGQVKHRKGGGGELSLTLKSEVRDGAVVPQSFRERRCTLVADSILCSSSFRDGPTKLFSTAASSRGRSGVGEEWEHRKSGFWGCLRTRDFLVREEEGPQMLPHL